MAEDNQKSIELIKDSTILKEDDSFNISKSCNALLYSSNQEDNELGRKIVINVLNNWHKVPKTHIPIWRDLVESAGFYPYVEKELLKEIGNLSTSQFIRKECHSSRYLNNMYFHEEQKHLAELLDCRSNIIVSAPTSFGKSLLIEEAVASKKFKNLVIIQPTLALLDETRKRLKKYNDTYKIIVRSSQITSTEKGNLFLLTAERLMEYKNLPQIDFFVIDEFYKLSAKRDDERSDVLNNAFHFLVGQNAQFYLLGPNIDGISNGFAEKYKARFIKSNYSLVDNQTVDIYTKHKEIFDKTSHHSKKGYKDAVIFKENTLFDILLKLRNEQTIIYCSSPERARKIAKLFADFLIKNNFGKNENLNIIEWISKNISEDWSMVDCLKLGIGIHDGALPKHMTSTIISYFNSQKLNYLFCTSTIIEGVNTSAKNIIYFDSKKGGRNIDYFDYANIRGRSGRLMIHYVGTIYNFNPPPKKDIVVIDIPFYEQNPISPEILIHLNDTEVNDKSSVDYKNIQAIPDVEKEIIKKNGLLVSGQQKIIEILKKDFIDKHELISWRTFPRYPQLEYILSLAWKNLLKPGESTSPFTEKQIIKITFDYGINKSISHLIKNQFTYFQKLAKYQDLPEKEILDDAIRYSFQAMKHWFGYKIPKWLLTINNLQQYVAALNGIDTGDYSHYASQIENDFIQTNLVVLNEFGVPESAIKKIKINPDLNEEQVLDAVRRFISGNKNSFIDYEIEKIDECL